MEKEKTIYNLKLHETLVIEEEVTNGLGIKSFKGYEITRVAGGWVYAFEFPGFREAPIVFVPFNNEFM